ncbi:hypothetical protein A8F94_17390 [Bacillus sp. FJAT-27225]|nr:hypothetical protein A8F94_17390 [Bacillus sp. FJAT-27225]
MYEQGHREMDNQSLIKLADYYKVSTDYIFGRTDNPLFVESLTQDEIIFITQTLELYRNLKAQWKHL